MLYPQPVDLARELFAELLEELLMQELLFERFQNPRLDLITPDGEPIVAGAFLTSAEACEPIAAGHDEPSAADAAFRQPRKKVLRPSCEADVAGVGDRSSRCALTVLRGVPEFVTYYPERRKLLGDPFCFRIQARDAFARGRILDVPQSVPDQATDVQLVVQDSGAAFPVPVNRAGTPRSSERSGDPILIESPGYRFRCDSCHELPEDPFNNRGFRWLALSLTSRHGPAAQRLHYAVAVTKPAGRFPAL